MKAWELTLESDAFNALKNDFNKLLEETLSLMRQHEGHKAELKVSLKISLNEAYIDTEEEGGQRLAVLPKFEHKTSSVLQHKNELSGILGGEDFELTWDSQNQRWCMRKIDDKQMNLFEKEHEDV